jgi:hypothetical protein
LRFRKERQFDWMRLDSALKKKSSPIYLGPKYLDTFWFTGWAWNCQIIFRFATNHGRACFILYRMFKFDKKTNYVIKSRLLFNFYKAKCPLRFFVHKECPLPCFLIPFFTVIFLLLFFNLRILVFRYTIIGSFQNWRY